MRCPFCAQPNTRVTETRLAGNGDQVRRRRLCPSCGERFTTFEKVELVAPRVVKSDGSREPFDEAKLRNGMLRALEKRPVPADAVEAALSAIVRRLGSGGEREVPSRKLGEWVMEALHDLDQVAYVRFASVYRNFQDVSAFRDEIERLEREPSGGGQQLPLLPEAPPAKAAAPARRRAARRKASA
jgi:transcriptional repressor NrdR